MTFDDLPVNHVDMILYHADCIDGFTAAWAVKRRFPDAEAIPVKYGEDPPDVTGKVVAIVDFSYDPDTTEFLVGSSEFLILLDHHKTALDAFQAAYLPHHSGALLRVVSFADNAHIVIDMNRSGAGMAWDFFLKYMDPEEVSPRPDLVNYVEDRDLWRWSLRGSREVNAFIGTVAHEFETWDELAERLWVFDRWAPAGGGRIFEAGAAVLRRNEQLIERVCSNSYRTASNPYHRGCRAVNSPVLQSEIGNRLAQQSADEGEMPMALVWWYDPELPVTGINSIADGTQVRVSLRSVGDFDVSAIAKHYGGGGHKNAAGCVMPLEDVL